MPPKPTINRRLRVELARLAHHKKIDELLGHLDNDHFTIEDVLNDAGQTVYELLALDGHVKAMAKLNSSRPLHITDTKKEDAYALPITPQAGHERSIAEAALRSAILKNHLNVVKFIIAVDNDLLFPSQTSPGLLWLATRYGISDIIKFAVDELKRHNSLDTVINQSLRDSRSDSKMTALQWAVFRQAKDDVDYLLAAGADPNIAMRDGRTCLHILARMANNRFANTQTKILKALLNNKQHPDKKADPYKKTTRRDGERLPIHDASAAMRVYFVKTLLKSMRDDAATITDKNNKTAYDYIPQYEDICSDSDKRQQATIKAFNLFFAKGGRRPQDDNQLNIDFSQTAYLLK